MSKFIESMDLARSVIGRFIDTLQPGAEFCIDDVHLAATLAPEHVVVKKNYMSAILAELVGAGRVIRELPRSRTLRIPAPWDAPTSPVFVAEVLKPFVPPELLDELSEEAVALQSHIECCEHEMGKAKERWTRLIQLLEQLNPPSSEPGLPVAQVLVPQQPLLPALNLEID